MLEHIWQVTEFMGLAFLKLWPYLLVTIPLAVGVRLSGAARFISGAFRARPVIAVLLATLVGAFSPFCSCGVIPIIASLLIGGVPLGPIMSFWLASPSMDPEIFFLSVAALGWELAIWRLAATFLLSLAAGYVTQAIVARGWLSEALRHRQKEALPANPGGLLRGFGRSLKALRSRIGLSVMKPSPAISGSAGGGKSANRGCSCSTREAEGSTPTQKYGSNCDGGNGESGSCDGDSAIGSRVSFRRRLFKESWRASLMVGKFMALALFLEALIVLYLPEQWISGPLGTANPWSVFTAALIGVPVYVNNLAALALVGGLLQEGMNPAAALAFLIAGPVTTIPAMAAVWGLTRRGVFLLYVSFALIGAILLGYLYQLAVVLF